MDREGQDTQRTDMIRRSWEFNGQSIPLTCVDGCSDKALVPRGEKHLQREDIAVSLLLSHLLDEGSIVDGEL